VDRFREQANGIRVECARVFECAPLFASEGGLLTSRVRVVLRSTCLMLVGGLQPY